MKTDRKRLKRGQVLANFDNLNSGDSFYSELSPKGITSYASIYGKQVSTEICLILTDYRTNEPKIKRLTKVTIL